MFWPLGNVSFSAQSPSGVVGAITFSSLFWRSSQVLVELATGFFVGPDSPVDCFMADAHDIGLAQGAGNLLRTPFELEQIDHAGPASGVDPQITSRLTSSTSGVLSSIDWTVGSIMSSAVSL